jgi:hypothetical protein
MVTASHWCNSLCISPSLVSSVNFLGITTDSSVLGKGKKKRDLFKKNHCLRGKQVSKLL